MENKKYTREERIKLSEKFEKRVARVWINNNFKSLEEWEAIMKKNGLLPFPEYYTNWLLMGI